MCPSVQKSVAWRLEEDWSLPQCTETQSTTDASYREEEHGMYDQECSILCTKLPNYRVSTVGNVCSVTFNLLGHLITNLMFYAGFMQAFPKLSLTYFSLG